MMKLLQCVSNDVSNLFMDDFQYKITQYLKDNVDWDLVFSVCASLKRKYNTGAETFVKSDIVSEAIVQASNGKLQYINEIGCDFYIQELDVRIELKSGQDIFPKCGKRYTVTLKVKNFRSLKNCEDVTMKKTFDYILMLEPMKCGIVSYENIHDDFEIFSDGIGVKVDVSKIDFIKEVSEVKDNNILLFDRYEMMKKQIIEDVRSALYVS